MHEQCNSDAYPPMENPGIPAYPRDRGTRGPPQTNKQTNKQGKSSTIAH
jgi:hypothetical protein